MEYGVWGMRNGCVAVAVLGLLLLILIATNHKRSIFSSLCFFCFAKACRDVFVI